MTTKPDQEKIEKLPKWAQDYIQQIEGGRLASVRALNEYCDSQTESPYYVDEYECTGEQQGPSFKRRYIQTRKMEVSHGDVVLRIYLRDEDAIELQWDNKTGSMEEIAMIPHGFHKVALKAAGNMRRRAKAD
jgi:hypothetical protein